MRDPLHGYSSRHNPRRHTVFTGKIQSTERYDRYYDFTVDLIKRGDLPIILTRQDEHMFRKAPKAPAAFGAKREEKVENKATEKFLDIEQSRIIPPLGSALDKRYSGMRLDGKTGEGALYVGSLSGVLREHVHYDLSPKGPNLVGVPSRAGVRLVKPGGRDETRSFIKQELTGSPVDALFHVYMPQKSFRLADFRLTSLFAIFTRHLSDPQARKRYEISSETSIDTLMSAINSQYDYSASRGMADAVADQRRRISVDGLCAWSARGESDTGLITGIAGDASGSIQALFGSPGTQIAALAPVGSCNSFNDLVAKRLTTPK